MVEFGWKGGDQLSSYSHDELWYTCIKLKEANYLNVVTANQLRVSLPCVVEIKDITYQGHEFLSTVRENKIWDKVKNTAKRAGVFSLNSLGEIVQAVATTAITAALQPHL